MFLSFSVLMFSLSDDLPESSDTFPIIGMYHGGIAFTDDKQFHYTLGKKLLNPLLLRSHMTFVYLQRNLVDNDKVSSRTDMPNCGPLFCFCKGNNRSVLSPW